MSYTVTYNVTEPSTAVSPSIAIKGLDFGSSFRVEKNNGGELILQNITSPIGLGEKYRFAFTEISNIYSGTTIDRAVQSPTKRGISLLVQESGVWTITDSSIPEFLQQVPVSAHLVVRVASNPAITATNVKWLIGRMLAGLFETGSTGDDRISALLRGALPPKDI